MKRHVLALFTLSCLFAALPRTGRAQNFLLTLADSSAIAYMDTTGGMNVPFFSDPGVTGAIGGMSMVQAMPYADNLCLRQMYRVWNTDSNMLNNLIGMYPRLFPAYERLVASVPTSDTPNEWFTTALGQTGHLNLIGALQAWPLSKGDTNTIIGITDTYFDSSNNDIAPKIVAAVNDSNNLADKVYLYHGTYVAGTAAGATDNGYLLPSIGWKCKMNVSNLDDNGVRDFETLRIAKALPAAGCG